MLLSAPEDKALLEAENGVQQVDYIAYLIKRGVVDVRESHVLEFHRIAVEGIYPARGPI